MIIYGDRFETPSVIPNRTACAMKDIALFIRKIHERSDMSDSEVLKRAAQVFREIGFSEMLRPLAPVLEQEETEIVQIYFTVLLKTLMNTDYPSRVLLFSMIIVLRCFEDITNRRIAFPVTIDEIKYLTSLAHELKTYSTLQWSTVKEITKRLYPSVRTSPFYVDLAGFSALRDNLKEATAKSLSHGAETDRTVRVTPVGHDDVGLMHADEIIFQLRAQTRHNPEFSAACASILEELSNIIPPSIRSDPQPQLLDVLPAKQVKSLLKTGRIPNSRRKKKANVASLPLSN
jgi:hypothetical protein